MPAEPMKFTMTLDGGLTVDRYPDVVEISTALFKEADQKRLEWIKDRIHIRCDNKSAVYLIQGTRPLTNDEGILVCARLYEEDGHAD